MNKLFGLILASTLSTGCLAESSTECKLSGGEARANSFLELFEQCRTNKELVFKCVIIPADEPDAYIENIYCNSPTLSEDAKGMIATDFTACHGSTKANNVVATCSSN